MAVAEAAAAVPMKRRRVNFEAMVSFLLRYEPSCVKFRAYPTPVLRRRGLSAAGAGGVFFHPHAAPFGFQGIEDQQALQRLAGTGDELDRLERLHRADHPGERRKYAHHRAAD